MCQRGRLLSWVEQERVRREAKFHFIYSILSQQSHTFYQNKHNQITSISLRLSQKTTQTLSLELSRANTSIQVERPASMQSTATIRVEEPLYVLYQANTCIYASYIMHTSWGACSKQPTQALLLFPSISSQIFAIKPPKSHKNMIWTSYDILTPYPLPLETLDLLHYSRII